mgnify:CR=1 FL=1|jgi:hypothetical protein
MEIILTGCDDNTAWQIPWFAHKLRFSNPNCEMVLADFGLSDENLENFSVLFDGIFEVNSGAEGWFKKPQAILQASQIVGVSKVLWLDTDCEVTGDIDKVFELTQKNKLGMVEDRPWTNRRPQLGTWYNSGVVLVEGTPTILHDWAQQCKNDPVQGDQEVLHLMMDGDELKKMSYIHNLPHKYNTLRLDYLDKIAVKDPLVIHHTGGKGKDVIRRQIDELFN